MVSFQPNAATSRPWACCVKRSVSGIVRRKTGKHSTGITPNQ